MPADVETSDLDLDLDLGAAIQAAAEEGTPTNEYEESGSTLSDEEIARRNAQYDADEQAFFGSGGGASGDAPGATPGAAPEQTGMGRLQVGKFNLDAELKKKWGALIRKTSKPAAVLELWETKAATWQRPQKDERRSFQRNRTASNEFTVYGVEFSPCSEEDVQVFEELQTVANNTGVPTTRVLASFLTHALSH